MALPLAVDRTKRRNQLQQFDTIADLCAEWRPVEPIYALHPAVFQRLAASFIQGFPGETMYAVKANHTAPVLDQLWQAGIRHFDVASLPEVRLIRQRFPSASMSFMAPVRLNGATGEAYHIHGVRSFAIDGPEELDKLIAETGLEREPLRARGLTLFVRMCVPALGAAIELSSKFGVGVDEGAQLLRRIADLGASPALTFHVGSLARDPQAYAKAIAICAQTARKAGVTLRALDVGGGFPAPYHAISVPPLSEFFRVIETAFAAEGFGAQTRLLCEPGRALCAEGISVVTQVIMRRDGALFLNDGIYGSLNEYNLPGWPARYPLTVYTQSKAGVVRRSSALEAMTIFGPTCDTLDKLPVTLDLPHDIQTGDWVTFGMMGAYSAALRTAFNGFYPDTYAVVAQA